MSRVCREVGLVQDQHAEGSLISAGRETDDPGVRCPSCGGGFSPRRATWRDDGTLGLRALLVRDAPELACPCGIVLRSSYVLDAAKRAAAEVLLSEDGPMRVSEATFLRKLMCLTRREVLDRCDVALPVFDASEPDGHCHDGSIGVGCADRLRRHVRTVLALSQPPEGVSAVRKHVPDGPGFLAWVIEVDLSGIGLDGRPLRSSP